MISNKFRLIPIAIAVTTAKKKQSTSDYCAVVGEIDVYIYDRSAIAVDLIAVML
jgi:hypothetical protein